ncbi:MAG: hypothetical protein H7246_16420 [Phycisphaerae bacterium]|nr:hypothetical protein [Saprospiraceae bacterium]
MAEKNIFSLLKDKMTALRPSEQHRDQDWDSLSERLGAVLPQQPKNRRRGLVLPLLLAVALLTTNAAWFQSSLKDQARLAHLETQTTLLQKHLSDLNRSVVPSKITHQRDTVWRTVYVAQRQAPNRLDVFRSSISEKTEYRPESKSTEHESVSDLVNLITNESNNLLRQADPSLPVPAELSKDTVSTIENQAHTPIKTPEYLSPTLLEDKKPTKPFAQKLGNALRPKFFKIGIQAGWLHASSKGLMHQGGNSIGAQAEIGLSRHWAMNVAHTTGHFHYKAHEMEAILGAPILPMPPSNEHHYAEMDVTGQKSHQWDLGIRYTFSQPGKPRPFIGIGWAIQTLKPFSVEYEIQHLPTGVIEKGVYQISTKTRLRNYLFLSTGLDIPMSQRLSLTLEGFYQRQWKKPYTAAPDLVGLRAGAHWLF